MIASGFIDFSTSLRERMERANAARSAYGFANNSVCHEGLRTSVRKR